jgi:hypothetical protein
VGVTDPTKERYIGLSSEKLGRYNAIWDTGATNSVLSHNLVSALGLISTGQVVVNTAGGTIIVNKYIVDLHLPNTVIVEDVVVTEAPNGIGGADMLIGMDIISRGDFAVTNFNNKTVFSFRIPSQETVNFNLMKDKPYTAGEYPRNRPCHCGSGKKYKACCGKIKK